MGLSLNINQVDDFLATMTPQYVRQTWQDISMPLQEYYFASRLMDKAGHRTASGTQVVWNVQIDYADTARISGQFAEDVTVVKDMMTQGKMSWGQWDVNYVYDITDAAFRGSKEQIIDYMVAKEHGMWNSYFKLMENQMFGNGPTSVTQQKAPMCSLLWWFPPYNTAAGYGNNDSAYQFATGQTNGFLGMDSYGFSSVGTGYIQRTTYKGWRHRVGQYIQWSESDSIKTIVECLDKCHFKPPHQYPETVSTEKPKWELLSTYSRIQECRQLLQAGNDNQGSEVAFQMGVCYIRGVPLIPVWAWSNSEFGLKRTDGIVMGVNWKTMDYYGAAGLIRARRPPFRHADMHNVRCQYVDDSGQMTCSNPRGNFVVTSSVPVVEND